MQEHTFHDIEIVVDTILHKDHRMSRLIHSESLNDPGPAILLKQQIIDRADGIFLWVRLALEELLEAFSDGADLSMLAHLLNKMPGELDAFYMRALNRIKPDYRDQALIMLDIIRCTLRPVTSNQFYDTFFDAEAEKNELSSFTFAMLGSDPNERLERILRSRTGGLLELVSETTVQAKSSPRRFVQFIHQTAKIFAGEPTTRSRLSGRRALMYSGFEYQLKSCFAAAEYVSNAPHSKGSASTGRIMDFTYEWRNLDIDFSDHLLSHASTAVLETKNSYAAILQLAKDEAIEAACSTHSWIRTHERLQLTTVVQFAIASGLSTYVEQCMRDVKLSTDEADELLCIAIAYLGGGDQVVGPVDDARRSILTSILDAMTKKSSGPVHLQAYQSLWLDDYRFFPFVSAFCRHASTWILESLLRSGQNVDMSLEFAELGPKWMNRLDKRSATALQIAVRRRELQNVNVLLFHGAYVNSLDHEDETPLRYAYDLVLQNRDDEVVIEIARSLLKVGAHLYACPEEFYTAEELDILKQMDLLCGPPSGRPSLEVSQVSEEALDEYPRRVQNASLREQSSSRKEVDAPTSRKKQNILRTLLTGIRSKT